MKCIIAGAWCGIAVAACGPPSTSESSKTESSVASIAVTDAAGYADELRQTYPRFEWPSDYRPDIERLIEVTRPGPGEQVERGVCRRVLAVVNSCAWYQSWDAGRRRGDTAATAKALAVMTDVLTQYPPDQDPTGRAFVREAAEHAKHGDPGMALEYVSANCEMTVWVGR